MEYRQQRHLPPLEQQGPQPSYPPRGGGGEFIDIDGCLTRNEDGQPANALVRRKFQLVCSGLLGEGEAWQNGVFTYAMLEGLKSGACDLNGDGSVQVSELKTYVFDKVSELTNGKQNPTSRKENLEYDFKVW